jgi:hypothetical protein
MQHLVFVVAIQVSWHRDALVHDLVQSARPARADIAVRRRTDRVDEMAAAFPLLETPSREMFCDRFAATDTKLTQVRGTSLDVLVASGQQRSLLPDQTVVVAAAWHASARHRPRSDDALATRYTDYLLQGSCVTFSSGGRVPALLQGSWIVLAITRLPKTGKREPYEHVVFLAPNTSLEQVRTPGNQEHPHHTTSKPNPRAVHCVYAGAQHNWRRGLAASQGHCW